MLWKVNITHDLNGGKWPSGKSIAPRTISAIIGESMPHSALEEERRISPVRVGFHFQGWSVRFRLFLTLTAPASSLAHDNAS